MGDLKSRMSKRLFGTRPLSLNKFIDVTFRFYPVDIPPDKVPCILVLRWEDGFLQAKQYGLKNETWEQFLGRSTREPLMTVLRKAPINGKIRVSHWAADNFEVQRDLWMTTESSVDGGGE